MPGLPGTGLGGIFYALLVVWMAMRESWFLARAASSCGRWIEIGRLGGLLAGIVCALWLEGWLLQQWLGRMPSAAVLQNTDTALAMDALVPALAVAPFVILTCLIVAMHVARFQLRRSREHIRSVVQT